MSCERGDDSVEGCATKHDVKKKQMMKVFGVDVTPGNPEN